MLLKSDHCGIEIIIQKSGECGQGELKSDHCGIEICPESVKKIKDEILLKSDHCGIEIFFRSVF